MRWYVLAFLGLVSGCGSSRSTNEADGGDASSDGPPPVEATTGDAADSGPDPCADAGVPPSSLACTGLYANFATKEIRANAFAYTPSAPLWSDGAEKQRWIALPAGTKIDISNPNEWTFPVGTKVFKEFRVDGQRVETRMFQKTKTNFWVYATYAWNADDSAATIHFGGPVAVGSGGATWNIPTNDDCDECHRGRQDRILGFEQVGLGLPGAQGLTLAQLANEGLVTPAPASISLSIGDDGTGLDALALNWIHVNCGLTCHNANPSAAGYGAAMLLRLDPGQLDGSPPNATTWDILRTTMNVPCVSGSVAGQPRIVPGDAAASVLYQLIDERGPLQMPPIASLAVDTTDVAVIQSWIQAMGAQDGGVPIDDAGYHDGGHRPNDAGGNDSGGYDASGYDGGAYDATGSDAGEYDGGDAGNNASGDDGGPDAGALDAAQADSAANDATLSDDGSGGSSGEDGYTGSGSSGSSGGEDGSGGSKSSGSSGGGDGDGGSRAGDGGWPGSGNDDG